MYETLYEVYDINTRLFLLKVRSKCIQIVLWNIVKMSLSQNVDKSNVPELLKTSIYSPQDMYNASQHVPL